MANFPGLKMTAAGRELQAKAQTGQLLKFTRVALGDGLPPADPDALVALVNECQTLSIQRQEVPGDGTAVLRVIMTNQGVATGFYMRELATFAEDPDTGAELLYSYSNAGDECDFLPAEGAAVVWEGIFDLVTVVGNAENVTAVIDDYITIALKSEVDALKPRLMPAGGTVGQMVRKASNAEGDVEYFTPEVDGFDVRLTSIEEPRVAVANQRVFTLQQTVTNGLAVYINGERLSRESWTALSATQLQLDDPLVAGTRVLFVNNEEAGPGRALNVSLTGPTLVYPASSNSFTITDYDSFSVYAATTTVGTVTRSGAALTLDIPAEAPEGTLDLEVTRDNVRATYRIAVGASAIAAPEILSPMQGATNVTFEPDLAASAFVVYPAGYDSHAETRWQVARDAGFTDLVFDQQGADNLTAISLAAAGVRLDPATRYYVRVQYHGATLVSGWSAAVAFNTASVYIRRPAITSPLDGAEAVNASLTVTAAAFSVFGGDDVHQASRWQVSAVADFSSVLVDSGWSATQLTSYKPAGLTHATQYFVRTKHQGAALGESEWSPVIRFTTADRLQGVFTSLSGGATARVNMALASYEGKLYMFGGSGPSGTLSDLWCYTPETNSWQQLASLSPREYASLVAHDGYLYLFGGTNGSSYPKTMHRYNIATNTWSLLSTGPLLGRYGQSMGLIDGKLYIFGGMPSGSSSALGDLWCFDIASLTWTQKASASPARYYATPGVIGGMLYVALGAGNGGSVNVVDRYDPSTNTWLRMAASGLPSRLWADGAVVAGKLYLFGGTVYKSEGSALWGDLLEFDPSTDAWSLIVTNNTFGRQFHRCATIGNKLFCFGGSNSSPVNSLFSIA